MKLDVKTILIILLSCVCLYFIIFGGGKNNSDYKKEKQQYIERIKELEQKEDSLNKERAILKKEYLILENQYKIDSIKNDSLDKEIIIINDKLIKTEKKANYYLDKLSINQKRIKELEKNPIYKEGESLLKSLSEKINE